jgi:hypothetical protein
MCHGTKDGSNPFGTDHPRSMSINTCMEFYDYRYYLFLDIEYWEKRILRFYDAFPALNYAYGIDFFEISPWMIDELVIKGGWDIEKQIQIIKNKATRKPKSVFEIGAGRGDLSCTLQYMKVNVDACEVHEEAKEWFHKTGQHFFGHIFRPKMPMIGKINELEIDWSCYDTIIMVESIEHIPEKDFQKVWNNIVKNFKGIFIVTNYIKMHPIEIGGDWPNAELQHCRLIDDSVYDEMAKDAKRVIFRQGSHLVLEF